MSRSVTTGIKCATNMIGASAMAFIAFELISQTWARIGVLTGIVYLLVICIAEDIIDYWKSK